jgi:outer membrane protein insertion porin family
MFGVAVNSDAGVTAQITIDERNFDISRPPTSWDDVLNGTAWRGAGQGFRIEAQPGSQVQRYLVSFTDPYFLDTNVSFSASGFYFDRNYFDWDESRYGARIGWGYRLTPDLSASAAVGAQNVHCTSSIRASSACPSSTRCSARATCLPAASRSRTTRATCPSCPPKGT